MSQASSVDKELFNDVPMTPRSGSELAFKYGFQTLVRLATALPESSRVIDVGAGRSTLGNEVCRLRPDINWVNADLGYHNKGSYSQVSHDAPSNLSFEAVNVLGLTDYFGERSFGRLFSYYMLPHIIRRAGDEVAVVAVEEMLGVTTLNGKAAVGPVAEENLGLGTIGLYRRFDAAMVTPAASSQAAHQQALAIVASTTHI